MNTLRILSADDESKIMAALPVKDLEWDRAGSTSPELLYLYNGGLLVAHLNPNPLNILYPGSLFRDRSQAQWELLLQQESFPDPLRVSIRARALGLAPKYITELDLRDHKGKLTVEILVHDKVVWTGNCLSITYPNGAVKTLHSNDLGKPFKDICGNGVNMFVQGTYSPEDLDRCRKMRVQQLECDLAGLRRDIEKKEDRLSLWKVGEISVV